jgi:hypothetical protein
VSGWLKPLAAPEHGSAVFPDDWTPASNLIRWRVTVSAPASKSVISRKIPLVAGIILLLSFFGQPTLGFAEEYIYVFHGATEFGSKYEVAAFTMELNGTTEATGLLKFIDRPAIGVTGSNYQTGRLRLTFGTTPSQIVDFEKRVWRENIYWESYHFSFRRSMGGPPSEAALELSDHECGPHNGEIDVRLHADTSLARLQQVMEADPILTNINARYLPPGQVRERKTSLAAALVQLHTSNINARRLGETEAELSTFTINIQNGTELVAVRKLRSLPVVEYADLAQGGCGGAERSYFIVQNVAFFENDVFSEQKFLDYVENGLRGMLGQRVNNRTVNFRLGNPVNGRLRVPPFTSYVKYKAVAPSEITRGEPLYWDRFFVTFEPSYNVANTTFDMSVVVTVESLSISRRSRGSDAAPGDEQFTTREDMGDAEAIITTSIERYFAGLPHGIRCVFAREGFDPPANRRLCG